MFKIDQFAFTSTARDADALLKLLGWTDWTTDEVVAQFVKSSSTNTARLSFNYAAAPGPVEVERLQYESGRNWLERPNRQVSVSHVGMHCTEDELAAWKAKLVAFGLNIVQEVRTTSHTNPAIRGKRFYHYCIFGANHLLGFDLKFIVREDVEP